MARLVTYLVLFFAFIALVSAQTVGVINTPAGPITRNVTILVTWTLIAQPKQLGVLQVINHETQDTKTITDKLDLNTKSLSWVVDVPPATYHFSLIDEAGAKFSGPFQVIAPKSAAPPAPGAAPPAAAPPGAAPPASPSKSPKSAALVEGPGTTPASATQSNSPHSAGNLVSTTSLYSLLLSLTSVVVFFA